MGRVATISIGQGGNQGFCIYENYALAFGNGGISGTSGSNMASCRIFKITDNEGIPVFTAIGSQFLLDNYTNNHTNTASLGKKFDSNDDFPLVYIPRCMIGSNQNCVVERIFLDGTSTDVQEISIGTYRDEVNSNSDIQWTTDGENLYMFGNTRSSYATTGNKFVFAKFELPDPTTGNVAIDLNEAIEFYYFEDYGFHNTNVLQGCKVINNVMILPVGFGGTAQPSHVYFWDCLNKKLIADVDMSAISSLEFEDVDIYRDTLLIYAQGGVIYQVDFQ